MCTEQQQAEVEVKDEYIWFILTAGRTMGVVFENASDDEKSLCAQRSFLAGYCAAGINDSFGRKLRSELPTIRASLHFPDPCRMRPIDA